jgi:hypothetical protein
MTRYLLWSFEHQDWWAPARNGYAHTVATAGRYTAEETADILANDVMRRHFPVAENDARDDSWPATSRKETR